MSDSAFKVMERAATSEEGEHIDSHGAWQPSPTSVRARRMHHTMRSRFFSSSLINSNLQGGRAGVHACHCVQFTCMCIW
jgi:hypothetical protein